MTDWSRKLAIALIVALLGIGIVCLVNGARRVGKPFAGFLVAKNGIVMSVGRAGWPLASKDRIFLAKVVTVQGDAVADAGAIQRAIATFDVGTPLTYRFRAGSSVFSETIPVTRFGFDDFLSIYAGCFAVGVCFALAGLLVFLRKNETAPPATAFLAVCEAVAAILFTGGDFYGPYWFNWAYILGHAASFAAVLHLAVFFPQPIGSRSTWRRAGVGGLYIGSAILGALALLGFEDPSTFLPLHYTAYLLLANALVLYVARLAVEYGGSDRSEQRDRVRRAFVAVILSGSAAIATFAIFPAFHRPVSPSAFVAPMALFPVLTARALLGIAAPARRRISVRSRLSLLLLAGVEATFLFGVGLFWVNDSWQLLLDDFAFNEGQVRRIDRLLDDDDPEARLAAVVANVQTADEHALVAAVAGALTRGERDVARRAAESLLDLYRNDRNRLEARRGWLSAGGSALVVALVILGLANAVTIMFLIRQWLIRPIERLADATAVIATGNLSYRIQPASTDEFAMLARSIDTMAASLGAIQRRAHLEREARRHAAGTVRDAERRRLARELHDGALQNLTAVKYGLEGELKSRGSSDLRYLLDGATKCITELRSIVDDLRAPDLSGLSLVQAIEDHAHALAHGRTIALDLDLPPTSDVADWARQDVYRVAQEAISNAVRHASPSRLAVRLFPRQGSMVLEVADDGCGFDVRSVGPGNGIVGMRERAAVLAADLRIESTPGRGTRICLEVPPSEAAEDV